MPPSCARWHRSPLRPQQTLPRPPRRRRSPSHRPRLPLKRPRRPPSTRLRAARGRKRLRPPPGQAHQGRVRANRRGCNEPSRGRDGRRGVRPSLRVPSALPCSSGARPTRSVMVGAVARTAAPRCCFWAWVSDALHPSAVPAGDPVTPPRRPRLKARKRSRKPSRPDRSRSVQQRSPRARDCDRRRYDDQCFAPCARRPRSDRKRLGVTDQNASSPPGRRDHAGPSALTRSSGRTGTGSIAKRAPRLGTPRAFPASSALWRRRRGRSRSDRP